MPIREQIEALQYLRSLNFFLFFLTNIFPLKECRQELVRKIFTDYKQRQKLDKQRGGGCKSVEGRQVSFIPLASEVILLQVRLRHLPKSRIAVITSCRSLALALLCSFTVNFLSISSKGTSRSLAPAGHVIDTKKHLWHLVSPSNGWIVLKKFFYKPLRLCVCICPAQLHGCDVIQKVHLQCGPVKMQYFLPLIAFSCL